MLKKKLGIFIFRRDLRIEDNYGLIKLSKQCDYILPIFILDSNQILQKNKKYFSNNVVQFICESLIDITKRIPEFKLFYGNPNIILQKLIRLLKVKYELLIGFNLDYSIYSIKRDNLIKILCKKNNIELITYEDDLTLIPSKYLLKGGTAFKQFGAFYKNAIRYRVPEPLKTKINLININIPFTYKGELTKFYKENINLSQRGGRINALEKLKKIKEIQKNYSKNKDLLDYHTCELSAYVNLGLISPREFYYYSNIDIRKQLYWRDYFLMAYRFLKMQNYTHIDKRYNNIKWSKNSKEWNLLMKSQTGFLLIDASMQQLIKTGYIPNRARLLLGSFWCKYLHINPFDPNYGSQVIYSKYLVDAIGCSQNKMNHHWLTEFDFAGKKFSPKGSPIAGRPMAIDNLQIKKFDPECKYIKKWLPHLKEISNKELINWNEEISKKNKNIHNKPIFDPKERYHKWIMLCKLKG